MADISVTDSNGNVAMGNLPVTVKDSAGNVLTTGTVVNGTASLTLPYYIDTVSATVDGNGFYTGSMGTGNVQYNLQSIIQTQGPAASNATLNAEWTIIKDYVENSGAFNYDAATGNYTMNSNDWCDKWTDSIPLYGSVDRGYCVITAPAIAKQELDSNQFGNTMFTVERYSGSGIPPTQNTRAVKEIFNFMDLTLMQFSQVALDEKVVELLDYTYYLIMH